jgi:acetoin utilization deacetylase AcuC-like enzyme
LDPRSNEALILYYCDHHDFPLPAGHRFPVAKYRMIRERLAADGIFKFEQAPMASRADVERAHDPDYVRAFLEGTLSPQLMRHIGFPWSEGLVRRTLASVGGTLAAARMAFETGWGGNLAGGTHHAFRAEGSGFCVFNDLAVAVLSLRAERGIERAAIIDLDVHQGDGTALIFENDPRVFTFSMHGRNNFPFRKQRSTVDIDLQDGTADEEYLRRLAESLPAVFDFAPGVIFYQSGVDALASDTLGRLHLTHDGLRRRDRLVMEAAKSYGAPFIITLGGGYSNPIELTAEAHANTFRSAARVFGGTRSQLMP